MVTTCAWNHDGKLIAGGESSQPFLLSPNKPLVLKTLYVEFMRGE